MMKSLRHMGLGAGQPRESVFAPDRWQCHAHGRGDGPPLQTMYNRLLGGLCGPLQIGIFHSQNELAAEGPRLHPAK